MNEKYHRLRAEDRKVIRNLMVFREFDVKTITQDNGLVFAMHGFVNDLLASESFFCKPYGSWEKGGVEVYNGLVRQYFPKGCDFCKITPERLAEVEGEINERPRKTLDTPARSTCLTSSGWHEHRAGGRFRGHAGLRSRPCYARPSAAFRMAAKHNQTRN